jgi:hypothetical protein
VESINSVKNSLESAMKIEGAIGVALVDVDSGMCLAQCGGGDKLNLDAASAGNTEVVRAKLRAMEMIGIDNSIEDMLITLGRQFHVIRILQTGGLSLFLYLALDKGRANLGMARLKMAEIARSLNF